jgi:hypothetical protein
MKRLNRRRAVAVFALLCSLLVFANACEAESDASGVFRSAQYAGADLDQALAARRTDRLTQMEIECGSLAVAGLSIVVATLRKR